MSDSMKVRAQLKSGVLEVRMVIIHPMETGRRKGDQGQVEPAHFIQTLSATLEGKTVLETQWGTGIAKNPYMVFRVKGGKAGDKLTVSWEDNLGQKDSITTVVELV